MEAKIKAAVCYCAAIHEVGEDVRNDAANIFSSDIDEYREIWRVLDFLNEEEVER